MRRICLVALVLGCALSAAAPAFALPHLTTWRTHQVATLVERFVNDLVMRRNLADGWRIAGPAERGALTRKVWMSGRELPVQQFDVLNNPRTAWYATWKTRTEIGLVISLRTGHGKNAEMIDAEAVLAKERNRGWVVDSFYPDGIFRLGRGHSGSCVSSSCKVTGLADYAPGGGAGVGPIKARINGPWLVGGVVTLASLVFAVLLGIAVRVRVRNRRARAAYLASRIS